MRLNYYDNHNTNMGGSRVWRNTEVKLPFSGGRPLVRYEELPRPRRKKRRRLHPAAVTALFLLLMTAAAVTAVALYRTVHPAGEDADEAVWQEEMTFSQYEGVELQRALNGDGTVLNISTEKGKSLSPQEIYRKLSPSVVAIELVAPDGVYSGSGIVMSEDGYIITNAHVIEGGFRADVMFTDGTSREGFLVGMDRQTDLAVLKVDATGLPVAEFGDSSTLEVGDTAYAIGNPVRRELRNTMTDGIISAMDRDITVSGWEMNLIQTTAAINPGNSGGALVDECGRVVGITNMKIMSSHDTIEGLGFAIPSVQTKAVVDQLIQYGHCVGRPVLGIIVTNQFAREGQPAGARIVEVNEASDAYEKGLEPGDVIIRANGVEITDIDVLKLVEDDMKAGDILEMEIWNENRANRTVRVELIEQYQLDE